MLKYTSEEYSLAWQMSERERETDRDRERQTETEKHTYKKSQ